ncbi:MAG: PAS domain S-box protein [Armatimonadota bacterium]|nr:PAS domain S-box protein [Armatimonadota bacterium]MCX7777291.1 PAS domain S-box protein [Armatimonadota bacterium]MDW8024392.1 PAS domain S-box protein [Armatimonadota bacterium]
MPLNGDGLSHRELLLRDAVGRLLSRRIEELRSKWREEANWRLSDDDQRRCIGKAIELLLPHMVSWLSNPERHSLANSLKRTLEKYISAGIGVGVSIALMFALRDALIRMLKAHLNELRVDANWDEIARIIDDSVETATQFIASRYERMLSKHPSDAGEKFSVLFEHAGDAILVLDSEGQILMANIAAEDMFDCAEDEMVGRRITDFASQDAIAELEVAIARSLKEGSIVLHGINLQRGDGTAIPSCLRITAVPVRERPQLMCIIRDITELHNLQMELEAARRSLEEQVRERTRQLQELYGREQKRSAQLRVLAKIAQEALAVFDIASLFNSTVRALQEHFHYYDVALFEVDAVNDELVLVAHSGAYEGALPKGYRQKIGIGIVGWVALNASPLYVGDVLSDPRYVRASDAEIITRSELAVPIKLANNVIGVIDVKAPVKDAFDEDDLKTLQAVADQIANAVQAIRQFQRAHMFRELNERIIDSFPESVAVLNSEGRIVAANPKFCQEVNLAREEIIGKLICDVVDPSLVEMLDLKSAIKKVVETGELKRYLGVQHFSPRHPPRFLEIHIMRLQAAGSVRVLFLADDATERSRRAYKLEMLLQITQAMGETLELNRLLHAILKSLTAGPGLGFNRAILFLVNEEGTEMETAMAVGPATREEAYEIWAKLSHEKWTLRQFIDDYSGEDLRESPFQQAVRGIKIPLSDSDDLLVQCLMGKEVRKLTRPLEYPNLHPRLKELFGETEVVCVPLVAKGKLLGLIIADNAFSGQPITSEEIEVLRLFATPAALAIDNARAYQQLQKQTLELSKALGDLREAQEKLIRSERLAAIGEVAARVAHDIRNPLATIGGYARAILKTPQDINRVLRNATVVYEEVQKLEELLREMLEFASPKPPQLKPVDLNELIIRVCEKHEAEWASGDVYLVFDLAEDLPIAMVDENQIERVLINLIQNGLHAIGNSGQITIRTWVEEEGIKIAVSDTGRGIPPDMIQHIFEPFFTTKPNGTGLGLAVVKRIVEDHGGSIDVRSQVGCGATFIISLPHSRARNYELKLLQEF